MALSCVSYVSGAGRGAGRGLRREGASLSLVHPLFRLKSTDTKDALVLSDVHLHDDRGDDAEVALGAVQHLLHVGPVRVPCGLHLFRMPAQPRALSASTPSGTAHTAQAGRKLRGGRRRLDAPALDGNELGVEHDVLDVAVARSLHPRRVRRDPTADRRELIAAPPSVTSAPSNTHKGARVRGLGHLSGSWPMV